MAIEHGTITNGARVQGPLAIHTSGLTRRFGSRVAVDALDLAVPPGTVCGLVGPNGAGKTTTIRMLLGLLAPSAGGGEVLGAPISTPEAYLDRTGALIEAPAFYPSLSGRANLRVLATLGGIPAGNVEEALEAVRLADRADDAASGYSLGMKQRLGVAAALLPKPELLILDEPTNGLDPAGIREMRGLFRDLATRGVTVVVSSHLLSEIDAVCDHIVMLQEGRLRFSGSVAEIRGTLESHLVVGTGRSADCARLLDIADDAGYRATVAGDVVVMEAPASAAVEINERAFAAGLVLARLDPSEPTLEEAFFNLTEARP